MEILVATHNEGKKKEIQQILHDYKITSLNDYDLLEEIVEDGATFAENAKIKAKYCFDKTGKESIGDDSGLVIPALDDRPGIFSARYAGDHDSAANIKKVLEEMKGVEDRRAYFITVLCMVGEGSEEYFEGRIYGTISDFPVGENGFGYDPIFIPDNETRTFAQMSDEEKNSVSHRANALRKLTDYFKV